MKLKQNEQGYSLMLALGVVVLFMVLGLSLITITNSGIQKNDNRQNTVLATDLSNKGIDYITEDIQAQLEKALKEGNSGKGLSKSEFETLLNDVLTKQSITCPQTISIGNGSQQTKVCIENIQMLSADEKDKFKRKVTFKSEGISNGKTFVTRIDMIVGTDAVPDQLRYAVSSNQGGDLYFHGGVEVQGDVKTSGNLYINKYAHWLSGDSTRWEESVNLRLVSHAKSVTPKIIMTNPQKKIYLYNTNQGDYKEYINRIANNTLSITDSQTEKILSEKLFETKNITAVNKTVVEDSIAISNTIKSTYDSNSYQNKINGLEINSNYKVSKDRPTLIASDCVNGKWESEWVWDSKKGWQTVESWKCYQSGYSKANFSISGDKVELIGKFYVNGNVTIKNAKLRSDAIIYTTGNVEITESTLSGIDENSTLIIFAEGEIKISNISQYDPKPSEIKGFFYTNRDMIMYGVGSNIQITGGVSAKNLLLTGVRGNTKKDESKKDNKTLIVDLLSNQEKVENPSRLKIIYDEDLIKSYTSFKRDEEEEYIKTLNEPKILKRY